MRLFGKVDSTINQYDRANWLTGGPWFGFDLTLSVVIPMELAATFAVQTRLAGTLDGQTQMAATFYEQSRFAGTIETDRN